MVINHVSKSWGPILQADIPRVCGGTLELEVGFPT